VRAEIAPHEQRLRSAPRLDAAEWAKLDLRLHQIKNELRSILWDARLAALLANI
jgi:hypothetical protein